MAGELKPKNQPLPFEKKTRKSKEVFDFQGDVLLDMNVFDGHRKIHF